MGDAGPSNILAFQNIRGQGKNDMGTFKVSTEQIGWKNKRNGQITQFKGVEVRKMEWLKLGKECQLKFTMKDNRLIRFDGFQDKDFEQVARHFSTHFRQEVEKKKVAAKGWHWGDWNMDGRVFQFEVDGKVAFEVAPQDIQQVVTPSKTDLCLEFTQDDGGVELDEVQLLEMRFYLPPKQGGEGGDVDMADPVAELKEELVPRAEGGVAGGVGVSPVLSTVTTHKVWASLGAASARARVC
eukprot:GDKI01034648.1.p1 GENE.GDKI01034648.1~~GDKI01034648.1.p1  ORF type:complete len:240 (+),score=85.66 GDKI01034648.1:143-862(+)